MSTVTAGPVEGDFSGSIYPLCDYLNCDPATWVCLPFPLSTIPQARLGNTWNAAVQELPAATNLTSAGPNALAETLGCIADLMPAGSGSHLVIDSQNNTLFTVFGGFEQLALGTSQTRVSTFALYVDGAKIASKDISYAVPYRP